MKVKYEFTVDDLKVPATNIVIRWPWFKRQEEAKRVRAKVERSAVFTHGLGAVEPLKKAQVCITALGDYSKYDGDGPWRKDVIDSIVARRLGTWTQERRWGLVANDDRKTIGIVEWKEEPSKEYGIRIEVFEC